MVVCGITDTGLIKLYNKGSVGSGSRQRARTHAYACVINVCVMIPFLTSLSSRTLPSH